MLTSACMFIIAFLSNPYVLLTIQIFGFTLKFLLLFFLVYQSAKAKKWSWPSLAIMNVVGGSMFEDFAWIASLSYSIGFLPFYVKQIFVRFGWIAYVVTYQSFSFLVDHFSLHRKTLKWYQYLFLSISTIIISFFMFLIVTQVPDHLHFEIGLQKYTAQYTLLALMPFTLITALYHLWQRQLPRISHYQLNVLVKFFLLPLVVMNIWQVYPFNFFLFPVTSNFAAVSLCTFISLFTLYFCVHRIIGLRFFNIHGHVHEYNPNRFQFVRDFKSILEALGNVSHVTEVRLLLQNFFGSAFGVKQQAVTLYLRSTHSLIQGNETRPLPTPNIHDIIIENFINPAEEQTHNPHSPFYILKEQRIFIRDEVEYTNFYNPTDATQQILHFLEQLNADIFLPLYEDQKILAAIVIERDARTIKPLYTDAERDEMVIFANYLSKIIYLLQNRNLNELLKQRKDIADELYLKHQEVRQYKESIRSFLRINNSEQAIGIIFYKNKKFSFGNPVAQDILGIDPNIQVGDLVSKKLKDLVSQVMLYKTTSNSMFPNLQGKRIVVTAIPHGDGDGAVITVHYPEVSDVIKRLIDHIKDPSQWDYLLYLETTESGKLINSLIPGNSEIIINFKMELLKTALSKKAILLDMPDADLLRTVELIHHISLRETLYTLEINQSLTAADTAIKLFGINPIFGVQHTQPILESLNKKGTLFIKNIHNLDLTSQEILAEFIRYGFYRMYKSERKVQSDVRLIVSSNKDLQLMVQNRTFSGQLLHELRKASIVFPDISTLTKEQIEDLMQSISDQTIANSISQKLFALSDKEKEKIINQKPESIAELKTKISNHLMVKSKKQELVKDITFDAAYNIDDPDLLQAARLGKKALKNKQTMHLLWDKFKCQNKIALFLGVNRSSVHRRCKAYNLRIY